MPGRLRRRRRLLPAMCCLSVRLRSGIECHARTDILISPYSISRLFEPLLDLVIKDEACASARGQWFPVSFMILRGDDPGLNACLVLRGEVDSEADHDAQQSLPTALRLANPSGL